MFKKKKKEQKKKKRGEWTERIKTQIKQHQYQQKQQQHVIPNTNAIWSQVVHTTYQLSSPSCSTRAVQKSLCLNEKC